MKLSQKRQRELLRSIRVFNCFSIAGRNDCYIARKPRETVLSPRWCLYRKVDGKLVQPRGRPWYEHGWFEDAFYSTAHASYSEAKHRVFARAKDKFGLEYNYFAKSPFDRHTFVSKAMLERLLMLALEKENEEKGVGK